MEYLRFWNRFPKMLLAVIFYVQLHVLLRGASFSDDLKLMTDTVKKLGDVASGFALLLIFLSIISIFNLLLSGTAYYAKQILSKCVNTIFHGKILVPWIQYSAMAYAMYLAAQNSLQIRMFYRLKALAIPEVFNNYSIASKQVDAFWKEIVKSVNPSLNLDLALYFSHFIGVTQEQVNSNILRGDVEVIEYSCIVIFLFAFDLFVIYKSMHILMTGIFISVCWLVVVLPFYKKFKTKFAYYLLWSYLDTFSVGELAATSDREAY